MCRVTRSVCIFLLALSIAFLCGIFASSYADDSHVCGYMYGSYDAPTSESSCTYDTIEDAGAYVREQMVKRKSRIVVTYRSSRIPDGSIFKKIMNEALKHTGEPDEGDYLRWQYKGWKSDAKISIKGGKYLMDVGYDVTYYTTASQEKKVDARVSSALKSLKLSGLSDYQKIKKIYGYVCGRVDYGYGLKSNLKYTAYNAIVNKKAVCQGYSVLMYRMLLEEGIDARVIAGKADGKTHTWNIVRIGKKYYNIDSTWDAGRKSYKYFLKCNSKFSNHKRINTNGIDYGGKSFNSSYPMSSTNYKVHKHRWSSKYIVDKAATCTESGVKSKHCLDCGERKNIKKISKLGHSCSSYSTVKKATTSSSGTKEGKCKRCGKTITKTVYKVSSVKLSSTSYTYDGKVKTPSVTVKDSKGNKLTKDKSYTVEYADGRTEIGIYDVRIVFKGRYSGSKTLTFKVIPESSKINSITASKGAFTAKIGIVRHIKRFNGRQIVCDS